jgi:hypothetical protein
MILFSEAGGRLIHISATIDTTPITLHVAVFSQPCKAADAAASLPNAEKQPYTDMLGAAGMR